MLRHNSIVGGLRSLRQRKGARILQRGIARAPARLSLFDLLLPGIFTQRFCTRCKLSRFRHRRRASRCSLLKRSTPQRFALRPDRSALHCSSCMLLRLHLCPCLSLSSHACSLRCLCLAPGLFRRLRVGFSLGNLYLLHHGRNSGSFDGYGVRLRFCPGALVRRFCCCSFGNDLGCCCRCHRCRCQGFLVCLGLGRLLRCPSC